MGRMRLQELAERHGVSVSTASRALSGKPGVSPELRRNLVEAAREVGYPLPGTLQGKEVLVAASRAAITDYDRNLFTAQVLAGMRERAAALGLVLRTTTLRDNEPEALEAMLASDRPGAIVLLTVDEPEVLALVHATGLPAVLVNGDDPWMRLDSIAPCNRSAARLATDHLLACGHRDLLFLQRPGRTTIQRRLEGWRDALHAAGLPADDARVLCVADWLPELAEEALGRHLDAGGAPFSAILCAGDSLAGGAVAALERARPEGAGRHLRHGDGRPADGRAVEPAAHHGPHPKSRAGRYRPRHAAAADRRPHRAATPRRARLPSGVARLGRTERAQSSWARVVRKANPPPGGFEFSLPAVVIRAMASRA